MNKLYLWVSIGIIVVSINLVNNFSGVHSYRSVYVYDLIKNTHWPRFKSKGAFVIGIVGSSNVYNELRDLASKKKAGTRNIEVIKLTSLSSINQCNIVYISTEKSELLKEVNELAANKGILVVTEGPGMLQKGAIVNFVTQEGKLKYEINKKAALQASLSFSEKFVAKGKVF